MVKSNTSNVVTKNVTTDAENPDDSKKYAYRNNYKGKNPMTHTQWRRYQRSKKGIAARANDKAVNPKEKLVKAVRRPVKERLPLPPVEGSVDSDFMDSELGWGGGGGVGGGGGGGQKTTCYSEFSNSAVSKFEVSHFYILNPFFHNRVCPEI